MNINALPLIDFLPGTESPGPCFHHSPDFSAAYGRGMASHAADDVNLDDGRDRRDRLTANLSATGNLGIIAPSTFGKADLSVFVVASAGYSGSQRFTS
jgi:hypothetical protein